MYSTLEILSVTLTPVVTVIAVLIKKLNLCKFCCCKSECSKSREEILEEEHIRTIALEEIVKVASTPVVVRSNNKTTEL